MRTWITAVAIVAAAVAPTTARANPADLTPTLVHGEVDPLTLASRGYGGQIGIRPAALHGLRVAIASFSLDVPDVIAQLGGNDGYHLRVRPSGACYVLYYLAPPGHDGFALGGSIRYLRLAYRHDDAPGEVATQRELSPEAIVGYQWHPFHGAFYLQPWLGLSVVAWKSGRPSLAGNRYDAVPVGTFFTVNIGAELAP